MLGLGAPCLVGALAGLALAAPPPPPDRDDADGDDPLVIVDEPPAPRSPWSWSGRALGLLAADVAREPDEDTLGTLVELGLGAAWEPTPAWGVYTRARLRHRLGARPGDARGELVPDLSEARLAWRPDGGLELDLGWLADVRWPELATPHPPDLMLGPRPPTGERADRQRAIPGLHLAGSVGALRLEALWQPVVVPARAPLRGSDWAPVTVATGPADLADADAPDGLAGGSLGVRARVTGATWSLGATWLWRVAPIPPFGREHRAAVDLGLVTGPVRWRAEIAASDRRAGWTRDLTSERAPAVEAVLSLQSAPVVFLEAELGVTALHVFGDTRRWLDRGPDDVDAFVRLGLLLAFDGVVRLDLEARVGLLRDDADVLAALAIRAGAQSEVALGVTAFGGNAVAAGRGALYDADDELWVRWVQGF